MSNSGSSNKFDAIREIAFGSIGATYAVLGGVLTRDAFRVWLTNNTNADIYLSTDGVTDMMKLPATSGRAYDHKTNDLFTKTGTQFYIRYATVPTAGWFGCEVEY